MRVKKWVCTVITCFSLLIFGSLPTPVLGADGAKNLVIVDSDIGEPYKSVSESLLNTLKEKGFQIGKNLKLNQKSIGNDLNKGIDFLKEIAKEKPDVVVLNGTLAAKAAETYRDHKDLKFVFTAVTDPVGMKLVPQLEANPTSNFTGVAFPVPVAARLKFVKEIFPKVKNIGFIYADMPQSHSYKKWLEDFLSKNKRFQEIKFHFAQVPLITGNNDAAKQMAEKAKPLVKKLEPIVDLFLSPNDQLGAREPFARMLTSTTTKPLIGLGRSDVMDGWGAVASIFPSLQSMGKQTGEMVLKIFNNQKIDLIPAEWVKETSVAVDIKKSKIYGFNIENILPLAGSNVIK